MKRNQIIIISYWKIRGFKALKQTLKFHYRLGSYKEMMNAYREMLTYVKCAVTRNYREKCINNIMDFISWSASQNLDLLQDCLQTTLKAREEAKNEVMESNFYVAFKLISAIHLFPLNKILMCVTEALVQNKSQALQTVVWQRRIWPNE